MRKTALRVDFILILSLFDGDGYVLEVRLKFKD